MGSVGRRRGRSRSGMGIRRRCICGGRDVRWGLAGGVCGRHWRMIRRLVRIGSEKAHAAERWRLADILERLVVWENSNNPDVLADARAEIEASCEERLPNIQDPFCGGGRTPLEGQCRGLPA